MKAGLNTVVKITYELRTEPSGEIVDAATGDNPLSFLFGHRNLLDRFEKNLEGLMAGNQFNFAIEPAEGYGEYDLNSFVKFEKKMFEDSAVPTEQFLFVGSIIPLQDPDGNHFEGKITDISTEHVTVDMNHPLAGKTLYFSGEVIEVREAQPVEIEHGHVHDGEHHHH